MKEKNLLEYVDTMVKNIKMEVTNDIDESKARQNQRLDKITNLITTHKNLHDEHIT